MGRMGNQIFQFASCLGIARILNLDLRLHLGNSVRTAFDVPGDYFIPRKELVLCRVYKQKRIGFDPGCFKITDGTDLEGHLQSPRYFEGIRDDLVGMLKFKRRIESRTGALWKDLKGFRSKGETVSVHVRRGDYVGNSFHPLCDMNYYERAFSRFPGCSFLVFSDDPRWCKENFHGGDFVVVSSGDEAVDMALMSRCDHHIIANSTFSWWGAWIGGPTGRVVAPARWFGNEKYGFFRFDDIYCEDWEVM